MFRFLSSIINRVTTETLNENNVSDDTIIDENNDTVPLICGENGHQSYDWSDETKENLSQLFFQAVRKGNDNSKLMDMFRKITSSSFTRETEKTLPIDMIVRFICQIRDVVNGKGEYTLSYHFLLAFASIEYKETSHLDYAKKIIYAFVKSATEDAPIPYGSWKDIRNLISLMLEEKKSLREEDPMLCVISDLMAFCFNLYIIQLSKDVEALVENRINDISLCAKWVPREGKKHGYVFSRLAFSIFHEGVSNDINQLNTKKYIYKKLRRIISALNKAIDTTEIKQCGRAYSTINYERVPSITMTRQKKAFMNVTKCGSIRSDESDRIDGASNFKEYIEKLNKGETTVNAKRNNITNLVKSAVDCGTNNDIITLINNQWNEFSGSLFKDAKPNMVAMVDTSASMYGDPIVAAIGLGICVASKSSYGRKVMTFEEKPQWVDLEDCENDFVAMVNKVHRGGWGTTTNFYNALKLLLDDIVENNVSREEVKETTLVIFSDMQINEALGCGGSGFNFVLNSKERRDDNYKNTMIETIKQMYHDKGIEVCGEPYEHPHIVFWNLRSTNSFPSLSSEGGTTMMSGYSPFMLNEFVNHGVDMLEKMDPFTMIFEILNKQRYDISEIMCPEFISAKSKVDTTKYYTSSLLDNYQKFQ